MPHEVLAGYLFGEVEDMARDGAKVLTPGTCDTFCALEEADEAESTGVFYGEGGSEVEDAECGAEGSWNCRGVVGSEEEEGV